MPIAHFLDKLIASTISQKKSRSCKDEKKVRRVGKKKAGLVISKQVPWKSNQKQRTCGKYLRKYAESVQNMYEKC